MMYTLTLDVSAEEFKILREAIILYRSKVFDEEFPDGEIDSGSRFSLRYDNVDKIYHYLENFKNGI